MLLPLRDENPSGTFPYVTVALIAVNVIVFAYEVTLGGAAQGFILKTAAIPSEVLSLTDTGPANFVPPPFTLISSLFVHGGLLHAAGNMLYLWIFGDNVEDALGHVLYLFFYLLSGVLAALAQIASDPSSSVPIIGASGAIAGVLGAYAVVFPRARVRSLLLLGFFIRVVHLPALVLLGFWFAIQIFSSFSGGHVAWFAHIGGFAVGLMAGGAAVLIKKTGP